MKRSTALRILAPIALVLAACGGSEQAQAPAPAPAPQETAPAPEAEDEVVDLGPSVTLTISHPFPASHTIGGGVLVPFAEEILLASGGNIDMEVFPGGALSGGPPTYENVVAGAIDVGLALQGYTAGRFPVTSVMELPFVASGLTAVELTEIMWDVYEEFDVFQDEYSDVKILALFTHEPGYFWSSGRQIRTIEDFSGLVLRSPGPLSGNFIDGLGAASVGMPPAELFDSLERGVIDGLTITANGIYDFSLLDVIDYGTGFGAYTSPFFIVMNRGKWDALTDAQRAFLEERTGRGLSIRAAQAYDDAVANALVAIEDAGIEITELEPAELARWQEVADGIIETWIAQREADGKPGRALYERVVELKAQR